MSNFKILGSGSLAGTIEFEFDGKKQTAASLADLNVELQNWIYERTLKPMSRDGYLNHMENLYKNPASPEGKIPHIKEYRRLTCAKLKDAKDAVESDSYIGAWIGGKALITGGIPD